MELNKNELCEYEILTDKIVFVDGVTRTGKAMVNNLLLGLDKLSSIQFINPLEQLMPIYMHGKMSRNALSAYLRLYFNENFYNYKLSRNLNFRHGDLTSIYNTDTAKEFHRNLDKADGDEIIDELNNDDIYFQFQTHDLLTHYSHFLDLNIEVYVIELFRHPIDTIHSWYKRGWGTRFDNEDPRSGTTLFKYKDYTIPHYAIGNEEEYINLNEMEKCVFMHNLLVRKSIKEYKKLNTRQKSKIILLKYEDMLQKPDEEINKICGFLNTNKKSHINKVMQDARVPREINTLKRTEKLDEITANVNINLQNDLLDLVEYYENKFYELKS